MSLPVPYLPTTKTLGLGDLLPVWAYTSGGLVQVPISQLAALVLSQATTPSMPAQYAQPASGGTVSLVSNDIHLITPLGPLAALTLTLPAAPNDGDTIRVLCKQAVTALTITPAANQTTYNMPASFAAGDRLFIRYDAVNRNWDRI